MILTRVCLLLTTLPTNKVLNASPSAFGSLCGFPKDEKNIWNHFPAEELYQTDQEFKEFVKTY